MHRWRRARLALAALVSACGEAAPTDPTPEPAPPAADGATGYTPAEIGPGAAVDVNDVGQVLVNVAGGSRNTFGGAYIWQAGVYTDLAGSGMNARAINDRGQVVGVYFPPGSSDLLPFIWEAGTGIRGLSLPAGIIAARAEAINNAGQVIGYGSRDRQSWVLLLWEPDGRAVEIHQAGFLFSEESPLEISENGLVVGAARIASRFGQPHGFFWRTDVGAVALDPFPGDPWSEAVAVVGRCQILGVSLRPGGRSGALVRPVIWHLSQGPTPMAELPPLRTETGADPRFDSYDVNDANDAGQAVGSASILRESQSLLRIRPVLWDAGVAVELPTPAGLTLATATAINDAGLIVGYSGLLGVFERPRALLWTPPAPPLLSRCA